jgi:hypothetical protein
MKRGNQNVFQCSKKNEFRFQQNGKSWLLLEKVWEVVVVAARVLECER